MKTSYEKQAELFQCREGWRNLIKAPLLRILELDGEILQVKEKFGTLRLYYRLPDTVPEEVKKEVREMVNRAEHESSVTCEVCGKPGELNMGGWVQTLCPEHTDEYNKRNNRR